MIGPQLPTAEGLVDGAGAATGGGGLGSGGLGGGDAGPAGGRFLGFEVDSGCVR